jgi:hypothetical protein
MRSCLKNRMLIAFTTSLALNQDVQAAFCVVNFSVESV